MLSVSVPSPSSDKPTPSDLATSPPPSVWELINRFAYPAKLKAWEEPWRDRYDFLVTKGYKLRPRYHPNWSASWMAPGAKKNPVYMVLDARLIKDDHHDPTNHCVPILDDFKDPELPAVSFMVMPVLRDFNDPEFGARGEVVDFVTQILEGMAFMHVHHVAHSDLTAVNIMMDARPILPQGWHFATTCFTPNGHGNLKPLARIDHPVRYYIIDFDNAVRFLPSQSPIVLGLGGRDNDPPELSTTHVPFDHYKLDVFTVGNVILKEFRQKFLALEFLDSLINNMMIPDFQKRPTAQAALDHWYKVRDGVPVASARWPLRKPEESVGETVVNTLTAARSGVHNLRYLFEEDKRTWANP
ncbi:hypothetical protein D9615_006183 [Tricholomella constricta]|uniref:Protein kinase domain-containing protein n=1 Tax=Tricholomella constricta TaxID=117010 RepID=A0A8H5M4A7_9AGAR|nr:hypothetical protein D9615_006183 [Tricholomella constricta]